MTVTQRLKRYYNSFSDYEEALGQYGYRVHGEVACTAVSHLNDDDVVLDVGCGTGLVGQELRRLGFEGELYGLDVAGERLKEARAKDVYDDLRSGDAYALPWRRPRFSAVISSAMVGLTGPRTVMEMQRVLQPGGLLCVAYGKVKRRKELVGRYESVRRYFKRTVREGALQLVADRSLKSGYRKGARADEAYRLHLSFKPEVS